MYPTRQEVIEKLLNTRESSEISTGTSCRSSSSSSSGSNQENGNRISAIRQRQWTDCEHFVEDNLREVYEKLPNLEKQIWGKLIIMEGNRRTAKAYLRHPLVTIDGSDVEFDGLRIGLSRFENPTRTSVVYEIFNDILAGIKLKIDPEGNVWAKRACYSPVFLKPLYRNRTNDLFMIDQRPAKVFDIRRFKEVLVHELKQSKPDRRKLEKCCLVCMKFSLDHFDLLKTPCWVILVHLVAIELLNLVLPKDNDLSSPSSSFTASPRPRSDLQEKPYFNGNTENNFVKRLYAKHHRDPARMTSNERDENHVDFWPTGPVSPHIQIEGGHGILQKGRGSNSMGDLRFPNVNDNRQFRNQVQFRAIVHQEPSGSPQVPMIPRRPQMGINASQRVFSMEALNGHKRPFEIPGRLHITPEPRKLPMHIERMQLQKWRSQDSGIASGSGSYGRK